MKKILLSFSFLAFWGMSAEAYLDFVNTSTTAAPDSGEDVVFNIYISDSNKKIYSIAIRKNEQQSDKWSEVSLKLWNYMVEKDIYDAKDIGAIKITVKAPGLMELGCNMGNSNLIQITDTKNPLLRIAKVTFTWDVKTWTNSSCSIERSDWKY